MSEPKVLCLAHGVHAAAMLERLQQPSWHHWQGRQVSELTRVAVREHMQVGVAVLSEVTEDAVAWLEACLHLRQLVWVVVLPAEAVTHPQVCRLVVNHVFVHLVWPVEEASLHWAVAHAHARALLGRGGEAGQASDWADQLGMVGESAAMARLRRQIRKVAKTAAPVLLSGPSGSGKELAAQAIHRCSARAQQAFVAVNCGAIAPTLIQSQLFGYERGAFTGAHAPKQGLIEAASGGTIFLDEIGDLPLELQTNLLRFLQEQTIQRVGGTRSVQVDVRVIAASHIDLAQAVQAGQFREDLFYRLNVLPVPVPSLQDRVADVLVLAEYFLWRSQQAGDAGGQLSFSRAARDALQAHAWPGNVRELCNRVQRAAVMCEGRWIEPLDLGFEEVSQPIVMGLDAARAKAERETIATTLARWANNVTQAAAELGVSRMTLYRLMDKHGLHVRPQ